jgi:hypothetical protein
MKSGPGCLSPSGIRSGWYGCAPLTATLQAPGSGLPGWPQLIIWLALVGAWALASLWAVSVTTGRVAWENVR